MLTAPGAEFDIADGGDADDEGGEERDGGGERACLSTRLPNTKGQSTGANTNAMM